MIMDAVVTVTSNRSLASKTFHAGDGLHVMVVDDDIICLSIVAGILKSWKYEVVTVRSAHDAISTLRSRSNFFHLIVTDVHMPEMDGFEFQRLVHREFRLPVVMMSADDKESSMLMGLEAGAAFYIVKPITYEDLKNLWQYTVPPKRAAAKSHVVIQEISSTAQREKTSDNEVESLINEEENSNNNKRENSKRKTLKRSHDQGNGKQNGETAGPRKAKVIWTAALHNRFLEAARKIGLERAVPKRILEIMNVPGLTRENVASHLQKYRIFLKRVMETSSHGGMVGKNLSEKTLRSSFATGHPSLMLNTFPQGFSQYSDYQLLGSSQLQSRFLTNLPTTANGQTFSSSIFPNHQQASTSSSIMPQIGYGQVHSMNKHDFIQQPTFRNSTNSLYQGNGDHGMNNAMQIYQHKAQSRIPEQLVPNANNSDITLQNLAAAGSGQVGFAGGDMMNNFNGGSSLYDGNGNSSTTKLASLLRNVNSGYFGEGASSSTRFGNNNQIPLRFSSGVVQQENINTPLMLMSPPLIPQQNINVGEGGEDNGYLLDQMRNGNNAAPVENLSIPSLTENELNEIFEQNQPKYPYYNEKQSEGGTIRHDYGNGMNQFNGYFPSFNQTYPTQQRGGAVMEHGPYINGHSESNQTWNQSAEIDLMDTMFSTAMY